MIDRGKIHKYFEVSAKTGIGIDILKKNYEIDLIVLTGEYETNYNLITYPNITKKIKDFNKLNKLNKYLNI